MLDVTCYNNISKLHVSKYSVDHKSMCIINVVCGVIFKSENTSNRDEFFYVRYLLIKAYVKQKT